MTSFLSFVSYSSITIEFVILIVNYVWLSFVVVFFSLTTNYALAAAHA